eukprot:GHVU01085624.1.p1 GENE.GHVU01085624.1~~GHVU01085624.1.p1  ORF type:complete len:372 (-),score=74.34 GHVU01085624.1:285-1262(-)
MAINIDLPVEAVLHQRDLVFGESLGSGGFGTVYAGLLMTTAKTKKTTTTTADATAAAGGGGGGASAAPPLRKTSRRVAIKKLHVPCTALTHKQIQELLREIAAIRELSHPSLVGFAGVCLVDNRVCLVTELCSRGSLHRHLHGGVHGVGGPAWPWETRRRLAMETAEAVLYLHTRNPVTIHRDLKSLNVVLDEDWRAKICDFGLTLTMAADQTHLSLRDGNNGGSPRYMAPECYDATGHITEKVDIWALGCIIVEIFGGPVPFSDCTEIQHIITKLLVLRQGPRIPSRFPRPLRSLLHGCLQLDPKQRWDAAEVCAALTDLPLQL